MSIDVKSLVCRGTNFLITWEPAITKLIARRVTESFHDTVESSACNPSFSLGHEVELSLTLHPPFDIKEVSLNASELFILCVGYEGVVVVSLPPDLEIVLASKTKSHCHCSSYILDRALYMSRSIHVRQASWVLKSKLNSFSDSLKNELLVAILLSDNSIRFYDVANSATSFYTASFSEYIESLFSDALGDSLVSFDTFMNGSGSYSILCVTRNGEVFMLSSFGRNLFNVNAQLSGPLCFLPAVDDNYGDNFVKIACLDMSPLAVVLINVSGDIMHCILLPSDDDDDKTSSLHVVERIPFANPEETTSLEFPESPRLTYTQCFVMPDILSAYCYYTWNKTGAYLIKANTFSLLSKDSDQMKFPSIQVDSLVRHLLSTSAVRSSCDPLIGLVHFPEYNSLFCTSSSLSTYLISLGPVELDKSLNKTLTEHVSRPLSGALGAVQPFLPYIQKLIKDSRKPPKLSLGISTGSSADVFELCSTNIKNLREHRLNVLSTVNEQIEKRQAFIAEQIANQTSELNDLRKLRDRLVDQARDIAEKLETLNSNQEVIESTAENLNHVVNSRVSICTDSEVRFASQVDKIKKTLDSKRALIQSLGKSNLCPKIDISGKKDIETSNRSGVKSGMVQKLVVQESTLINDLVSQVNSLKLGVSAS